MEVRVRRTIPAYVASLSRDGPLDKVGDLFEDLQAWAKAAGVAAEPIIGVFVEERQPLNEFGKPHGAAEGHAEAWIEVPADVVDDGADTPVLKETTPVRIAVAHYKGTAEQLFRFSDQLRRFLRREGFTPTNETRHIYRHPDWQNVAEWDVEVQVVLGPDQS